MQSMPYYPQGYQGPPYAGGVGGTVMNNGQPMMPHPHGLPPMHGHDMNGQPQKRKQVKNACTNCQKACKKCDDARPCPRCVKYNISDSCINSVRKERKKGIKRGPYKRRQKTDADRAAERKVGDDQSGQYAMRAPPIPYGFPGGLNQYGQPNYEYGAHQMVPPYNMVNPMYHQMGYPVMMQGQQGQQQGQQAQQQGQQQAQQSGDAARPQGFQPHASLPQHYGNMVQQPGQQQSSPQQQPAGSPQVYYQQSAGTGSGQPSPEPKSQAMTPMPSASTSSNTASSPSESTVTVEEESSKYARLSQLCTAALHQEKPEDPKNEQQQPEAQPQ